MSNLESSSPSLSLLKKYFGFVSSLECYVQHFQPVKNSEDTSILDEVDWALFRDLSQAIFVASDIPLHEQIQALAPVRGENATMDEVIPTCQKMIMTSKKANVLTMGYKMTEQGVINFAVNTIVTALSARQWNVLLQVIGRPAMIHLLTRASIFTNLPNGCLCQMTGKPLYSLPKPELQELNFNITSGSRKRKRQLGDAHERPAKRLKIYPGRRPADRRKTDVYTERSPVQILLIRQRMFYARPVYTQKSNRIAIGLPFTHILNRLETQTDAKQDPDPRMQQANSRRLAKYVFPRQYGIPSAFHFFKFSEREAYQVPDFVNRDKDIEKLASSGGPKQRIKTPKRLKQVLPILDKLIWRHGKCKYKLLLDGSCPSKMKKSQFNSDVILEMMSENKLLSQMNSRVANNSLDTEGNSILPMGQTQAEREAKRKPHFAEFCCSHEEVYRFVIRVVHAVIPKSFWGSKSNFKVISRHVKTFITARRYEKITLHHALQDFSTSACEWLMPPGDGKNQMRVPVTDTLKRRELLEDFLFWFFDSFIVSLLRTTFYVTESAAYRNHILYFRHDDWNTLCAPLLRDLKEEKFEKVPQDEADAILQQRKLGFSFVRLLPKELGVRPIVNLRRKQKIETSDPWASDLSINKILQAALQILTYEKANQPEVLGAACFSVDDHYAKFKEFKTRLPRKADGSLPRLYFAKLDVQACFDTIEQTKLLNILKEILSECNGKDKDNVSKASMAGGYVPVNLTLHALIDLSVGESPHFVKFATELANTLRHTIFVDQVRIKPKAKALR
ncbi:Telomerase reverse transcriptase [Paramarasmius palmivorus]|uniref:Telomerase reverse transcriptase n=1 Tax=Paramarasmius palmivorus TaxID=297713 RepID=A0AAW0DJK8_9AGAR